MVRRAQLERLQNGESGWFISLRAGFQPLVPVGYPPLAQGHLRAGRGLGLVRGMQHPLRLGILGSGKGSNFRAIADAIAAGELAAEVRVVVSDVEAAGILALARERGLRAEFLAPGRFRTKLEPEAEVKLVELLRKAGVEWVVLAGYMRMIKEPLLEAFPRRIINLHPSLLPAFPGLEAWRQAVDAGATVSGCTVHYVDAGMDTGEVIAQAQVPVFPDDTAATLHARIQVEEHRIYPEVLRRLG